jgi:tetratricopeptide (TPR) repeat protein
MDGRAQQEQGAVSAAAMESARREYQQGVSHYEAGRFEEALQAFQRAYALAQLPDLLVNQAKAAERLRRYEDSAAYLERYLGVNPKAPDREQIRAEIVRLRKLAAESPPVVPQPGVTVTPPPVTPPTPPGVTTAPPLTPAPPPRGWQGPPWPALGLMGGGVVLLVIGAGLGGGAMSAARAVESGTRFDAEADARGRALNGAAITFDVLGAAALLGGAAWTGVWYYQKRKAGR